jgi:hypothetical protein
MTRVLTLTVLMVMTVTAMDMRDEKVFRDFVARAQSAGVADSVVESAVGSVAADGAGPRLACSEVGHARWYRAVSAGTPGFHRRLDTRVEGIAVPSLVAVLDVVA